MTPSGADRVPRLVLDTSAYSHLRTGDDRVLDLLARAEVVIVPVTVLGELEGAFSAGLRAAENRRVLASFLAEPSVTIVPTTTSVARRYGRIYAQLRRAGTPIPVNDMWIAAAAIDSSGALLTFDGHFNRVDGLDCIFLSVVDPRTEN